MAHTDIPLASAQSLVESPPSISLAKTLAKEVFNSANHSLATDEMLSKLAQVLMEREVNAHANKVRCVVAANVADLAAFAGVTGGTPVDGVTNVAGDRVLLVNQTTTEQNGVYVVGTVAAGVAPLTRASDMPAGAAIERGRVIECLEGTLYANSSWKALRATAGVVGTAGHDPLFYPRKCSGVATLVAGTVTLGAAAGLWLFSTTKSQFALALNTPGTVTNTVEYQCAVAGRTAGKSGTAAAVIQANVAAGTINTADVSTLDWTAHNW